MMILVHFGVRCLCIVDNAANDAVIKIPLTCVPVFVAPPPSLT